MNETRSDRTPEQVMAEAVRSRTFGLTLDSQTVARRVPDALREAGFAVVPVEPTDKMVEAMIRAWADCFDPIAAAMPAMWRAAVAADEEGTDG